MLKLKAVCIQSAGSRKRNDHPEAHNTQNQMTYCHLMASLVVDLDIVANRQRTTNPPIEVMSRFRPIKIRLLSIVDALGRE
jgi:hypothetical protein